VLAGRAVPFGRFFAWFLGNRKKSFDILRLSAYREPYAGGCGDSLTGTRGIPCATLAALAADMGSAGI
jgi:hypothetical protein